MLGPSGRSLIVSQSALFSLRRAASTATNLVQVTKNEDTGVSIISLGRKPVNALNLELLTDLDEALRETKKDGSTGVILTSSLSTIFSGGLDIMEMYKPDFTRATQFWRTLQDMWMTLYGFTIPTAVAINGSSPAGGCLLAMSCEYRVMTEGKHTIGLNETRLGIVAPKWFMTPMINTIGYRHAEKALLSLSLYLENLSNEHGKADDNREEIVIDRGALFTPEEALNIGLVDDVVANQQEAISKCQDYITSFAKIPGLARSATKANLRGESIAWLKANRNQDTEEFLQFLKDPKVQMGLDFYIQSLKNKSKL